MPLFYTIRLSLKKQIFGVEINKYSPNVGQGVSTIPEVSVVVLLEVADAALLGLHGAASAAAATASTDAGLRDDGRSV